MKKIYTLFQALIFIALTKNTFAQCTSTVGIGSASNLFTQIRWTTNPVAVDKNLNTVVFAHRNNASTFGGSSGNLRYDVSTNGGTTWSNDLGVLNPLMSSAARYPNAVIYNPTGNTTPSNAYIGYIAGTINGTGGWNGQVSGVRQLSGTGNTENYNQAGSTNVLIPNSMTKGAPGVFWAADAIFNGTIITGFRVYKGTWNGSNDINWSLNFTATPPLSTAYNGTAQVADYNVAFDPTGNIGWLSFLGHATGGPSNYSYYPIFYKTTDGGNTWNGPIQVDINQFSCVTAMLTGTNVASCAFEHDLTVDINGNPHFMTTVGNGNNAYAVYFGYTHHIYDITSLNGVWNAYDVANVNAGRGTFGVGTNSVSLDMFPQISRTADGKKIFYSWTDNSTYTVGAANQSPNLMSRAFDVTTNKWTGVKDFTSCNAATNGLILMPHIADEVLEPSATSWKMAGVYGVFTVANDPGSPCNFRFMDNMVYNSTDFTVSQPVTAVSIQEGSSWLLCPASSASLSITGSYSQILWNNGAISNSISVSTPSNYIVTVRNGCTFGADTIAVNGLTTTILPANPAICIGGTSTLSTVNNAFSYTWSPGSSTSSSIVVSPTTSTLYTLTTSGTSCTSTQTVNLTVNPLPVISISGNTTVCSGSSITQTASGAATYSWSTGATTNTISISPSVNTSYTVTGVDANACVNTQTASVNVDATPTVGISGSNTVCAGSSIVLTANGASTYSWNTGAGTNTVSVSPSVTTTYSATGTGTNSCSQTSTITVTPNALPVLTVSSTSTLLCSGFSATLSVNGAGTYTWSTSSSSAAIVVSPTITTSYTVTGSAANTCSNSAVFTQSVSSCAGIHEQNGNVAYISVYPNPNNGEFTIKTNASGQLSIINELGQTVGMIELRNEETKIKLENLPGGIYFITGKTNDGFIKHKLIVH